MEFRRVLVRSLSMQAAIGVQPAADPARAARIQAELQERVQADKSTAFVTFVFLSCAIVWLVFASFAGLISSIKLHQPDFLTQYAWLTFGRIRTLHLNAVAYGWAPMAAFGVAIWTLPRLLQTRSEERRVGKGCFRTCSSRWAPS